MRAVPCLCEFYPGICLTTEEKARRNLSQSKKNLIQVRKTSVSDWLRAGRGGDRTPVGARFSAPVQTGPGAHPASYKMGTGSFPGVKSSRGVTLTPHPLLVTWSWKSRAIPLFPLWVVLPVQSLSACTRVPFTFCLLVPLLQYLKLVTAFIRKCPSALESSKTELERKNQFILKSPEHNITWSDVMSVPFFLWRINSTRTKAASFLRLLARTQSHIHTTSRLPLNEWSAHPRGHYLHNTQQT